MAAAHCSRAFAPKAPLRPQPPRRTSVPGLTMWQAASLKTWSVILDITFDVDLLQQGVLDASTKVTDHASGTDLPYCDLQFQCEVLSAVRDELSGFLQPKKIERFASPPGARAAADVHATQFHAIRKKDDLSSAERLWLLLFVLLVTLARWNSKIRI